MYMMMTYVYVYMMKCVCVMKNDHFFGAMCLSFLLLSSLPSERLKKRKKYPPFIVIRPTIHSGHRPSDDVDEDVEDDEDFVALFCQQLTREVVSNQRPPGPIPGRRR